MKQPDTVLGPFQPRWHIFQLNSWHCRSFVSTGNAV